LIGSGCVHCGVIGMVMEATPANPIRRKGLNDVGPFIAKGALDRIGAYVGSPSTFDGVCWREGGVSAASARAVRRFDHRAVGAYVTHQVSNGWTLGYGPCISDAFGGVVENADMRRN